MQRKNMVVPILAASALLVPAAVSAQAAYEYQLINYPGGFDTYLVGINDRGIAAGYGWEIATGSVYPFVYDIGKESFSDVPNVAGLETFFSGVAESGRMVGSVNDGTTRHGVIRDRTGADTLVSHPAAVSGTYLRGVANAGPVSGMHDSAVSDGRTAVGFVYDPDTDTFTDFAPAWQTVVQSMNSTGDVVGWAIFRLGSAPLDPCPDLPGFPVRREYGLLRATDGSLTYFQVNAQATRGRGINDRGQIAGNVVVPGEGIKGFVIDGTALAGQTCVNLTVPAEQLFQVPDASHTFPYGITNSGTIVGIFLDPAGTHGFVARPR